MTLHYSYAIDKYPSFKVINLEIHKIKGVRKKLSSNYTMFNSIFSALFISYPGIKNG